MDQSNPELQFWRELALWLADVTAATAYGELELKTTSKSEKRRHLEICQITLDMLTNKQFLGRSRSGEVSVRDRLKNVTVTFAKDRVET